MLVKIEESWSKILEEEFDKTYFNSLIAFVEKESTGNTIYPSEQLIFSAFDYCPFYSTKVVIIGQDPYHGAGQANGLCFSVNEGIAVPPSLRNIFKEIENDIGKKAPLSGNLKRWAAQGVLMLNATFTVKANSPGSHQQQGWETFTDAVISQLSANREKLVFLLWGAYAVKKGAIIDTQKHLILTAAHPSPFAAYRGFFGCGHFSKTNAYLRQHGMQEVDW